MSDTEKSASTVIIESIRSFLRKAILHVHSKIMLAGAHGGGRIYHNKKKLPQHSISWQTHHFDAAFWKHNNVIVQQRRTERKSVPETSARHALVCCRVVCAAMDETSVEIMGRMFCCNFLRKSRL
jgi:hypothetical protein